MKSKVKYAQRVVQLAESEVLSMVAKKLKDKLLFPDKVEESKKFFTKLKSSEL